MNDASTKIKVNTINVNKSTHFTLGILIMIIPHRSNVVSDYMIIECILNNNSYYISIAATKSTSDMTLIQFENITIDIYYI